VLFPLLLDTRALFLFLLLDALSLLPSTLFVFFLLSFACLAPLLFLFLALLLASLLLLFPPASPLFLLGLLCPLALALLFALLLMLGLPFQATSLGLLLPLLLCLAAALLFFGRDFSADFLYAVLAHLGQALLFDQLVQQGVDGLCDLAVDAAALARALNQGCSECGGFGQEGRVAVGLAVDEFLEGSEQVGFGGLEVAISLTSE
jgi:hypothetical protein